MECVHLILSKQQDGIDVEIRRNAESPAIEIIRIITLFWFYKIYIK